MIMANNDDGLASGRDRRSNAGARMSRLLDAEDDDDFYKTTYGGFTEVGIVTHVIKSLIENCFMFMFYLFITVCTLQYNDVNWCSLLIEL